MRLVGHARREDRGAEAVPGTVAPIVTASLVSVSLSLGFPLFALVLERAGASGSVIGLNSMAAPLAMVLIAPAMPGLVRRFGPPRLIAAAIVAHAAVMALIPVVDSLVAWTLLRAAWGLASALLFFTAEFWIVAAAPAGGRGRVIGIYGIVVTAAFTLGPLIPLVTGDKGALPFLVAAAIALTALLPLWQGRRRVPAPDDTPPAPALGALGFFRTDPSLLAGIMLFGVIEYGVLAMASVWGLRAGFEAGVAVSLLAVFALGAMILQGPLGMAADRFSPRPLLAMAGIASCLAPLAMALAAPAFLPTALAMLVWGGFGAGLYTLALAGLGARYEGQRLAEANAAVTIAYGIGALAAPPLMGTAMDAVAPPHGLMIAAAALAAVYVALTLTRLGTRPRPEDG